MSRRLLLVLLLATAVALADDKPKTQHAGGAATSLRAAQLDAGRVSADFGWTRIQHRRVVGPFGEAVMYSVLWLHPAREALARRS